MTLRLPAIGEIGPRMDQQEMEKHRFNRAFVSTATGIRTRVSAVRGRRPSPLDDSGGDADRRDESRPPVSVDQLSVAR